MVLPHELKFIIRQEKMRDEIIRRRRDQLNGGSSDLKPDVVGNERSKRYYLPSDKNYRRTARQKNAIFFASEREASDAGYRRLMIADTQNPEASPSEIVASEVFYDTDTIGQTSWTKGPTAKIVVESTPADDDRM